MFPLSSDKIKENLSRNTEPLASIGLDSACADQSSQTYKYNVSISVGGCVTRSQVPGDSRERGDPRKRGRHLLQERHVPSVRGQPGPHRAVVQQGAYHFISLADPRWRGSKGRATFLVQFLSFPYCFCAPLLGLALTSEESWIRLC